jgi:dTDP-4-amino-4,6-dideoxygalactose transaminase
LAMASGTRWIPASGAQPGRRRHRSPDVKGRGEQSMNGNEPEQRLRFHDVRIQNRRLGTAIEAALRSVIEDGRFELGREVYEFEAAFAAYCGTHHAVSVHSGTAALHLALRALGVGRNDEVITVANSDVSTATAIRLVGARPVFVDIEPTSYNMNPQALGPAITSKTRALIPVHLYGRPADMAPILEIADRHGLAVVEDAAIATGAVYRERKVGSLGHAGCFSFAPAKVLSAFGWGGMVTTNDVAIARRIRMLRAYGEDPDVYPPPSAGVRFEGLHPEVEGWNLRMDTLQAAVLLVKLPHLDAMIDERRAIAARYRGKLAGHPVVLPDDPPAMRHVYRNVTIRVANRDAVRRALYHAGIPTGTHYIPPAHLQPVFKDLGYPAGSLPVTERVADELITLPIYPGMGDGDVDMVVDTLADVLFR